MEPIRTITTNVTYTAERCNDLPSTRFLSDDNIITETVWELSDAEKEQIQETGKLYIYLYGDVSPILPSIDELYEIDKRMIPPGLGHPTKVNLCGTCIHVISECTVKPDSIRYGNSYGNDNVIYCPAYRMQEETKRILTSLLGSKREKETMKGDVDITDCKTLGDTALFKGYMSYKCPSCRGVLERVWIDSNNLELFNPGIFKPAWCAYCGQAIDWDGVDEEFIEQKLSETKEEI